MIVAKPLIALLSVSAVVTAVQASARAFTYDDLLNWLVPILLGAIAWLVNQGYRDWREHRIDMTNRLDSVEKRLLSIETEMKAANGH